MRRPPLGSGLALPVAALLWLGAARAGADRGDDAPTPIVVPASFHARTATLEPSGIAWARSLDRYLVVSDDTGNAHDHHQPWLLALDRAGAFDEAPVPILGIDEINDAESICPGPDGLFFLATSHSPNRKGVAPPIRRMLLLLRPEGRAMRVIGRADLTTARDRSGHALLEIAGLPPDGRLDIEALTFREGALLVGLKSPLSAREGAVVLRLEGPVAALRAGRIAAGALTRLWEVPLAVTRHKVSVPQGIADMATLADGSLVLVANAPKGSAPDGGGALYWFRPGTAAPVLLHRFRRFRPEGVTLADDARDLVLVFDSNDRAPFWMHWPLPVSGPEPAAP